MLLLDGRFTPGSRSPPGFGLSHSNDLFTGHYATSFSVAAGDRGRAAESELFDSGLGRGAGQLQRARRALEGADDLRQTGVSVTNAHTSTHHVLVLIYLLPDRKVSGLEA